MLLRPQFLLQEVSILTSIDTTHILTGRVMPCKRHAARFLDLFPLAFQGCEVLFCLFPTERQFNSDFWFIGSCHRVPRGSYRSEVKAGSSDRMIHPVLGVSVLAANPAVFLHILPESNPEPKLLLLVLCYLTSFTCRGLYSPTPVVRLAHHIEFRRDWRVADPPKFDFQTEKINLVIGALVKPIQGSPVFIRETLRNPYARYCLQSCGLGQKLSQVRVVSTLNLILDEYPTVARRVLAEDVCTKRTDILLLRLQLQLNTDRLTQKGEVLLLGEPRRKLACFGSEYLTQIDFGKAA